MNSDKNEEIIKQVRKQVEELLKEKGANPNALGYIHRVDAMMQSILKEKYNIDYVTTAEKYPNIIID